VSELRPILLSGRPGGTTHREVELLASLPSEMRLIGGLAVMCRVGVPHRTTVDLDVITRGLEDHHESISRLALTSTGGGQYSFEGGLDLDVVAVQDITGERLAEANGRLVATTVGLIVMKATAVPLRASSKPEKRSSDLYDIGRLLSVGRPNPAEISELPAALRQVTSERLHTWFVDDSGRDRTYREVRRFDEPPLDLDEVADAVEELFNANGASASGK